MPSILFQNASVLDGREDGPLADRHVLVEDGVIREVSDRPIQASSDAF